VTEAELYLSLSSSFDQNLYSYLSKAWKNLPGMLVVGGLTLGGIGDIMATGGSKKAIRAQRKAIEEELKQIPIQAGWQVGRLGQERQDALSRLSTMYAAAGLRPTGTPTTMLKSVAKGYEKDIEMTAYNAWLQTKRGQQLIKQLRAQEKALAKAQKWQIGSTILTGAGMGASLFT